MRQSSPRFHLLLRAASSVRVAGRQIDLVEQHNKVFKELGSVAIAKFGAPPSEAKVAAVKAQLAAGQPTSLFIVCKQEGTFSGYCAPVIQIYRGRPPTATLALAPTYYRKLGLPGLWIVLGEKLESVPLKNLQLASNGRKLLDVLSECGTSFMLVTKRTEKRR